MHEQFVCIRRKQRNPHFGRRAMKQESPVFPRIEQLVPHRGAMLWLDRLTGGDVNAVEAEARVPSAGWYLDERGYMPAWIGIELMAQAVAATAGLAGRFPGKPPKPAFFSGSPSIGAPGYRAARGILFQTTTPTLLGGIEGMCEM